MVVFLASGGSRQQPVEVRALEADDADVFDLTEFGRAASQRGRRKFDRAIGSTLAARQGFQQPTRLFPASASEFGYQDVRFQTGDDVGGVASQETLVGTGQTIF